MATKGGQTGDNVEDRLLNEGYRFNFFQAVSLLERMAGGSAEVGGAGPLREECLRFQPDTSLGFPTSQITRIEKRHHPFSGKEIYWMTTTFMGLYGISAPTPVYFTELITSPDVDGDSLRDFLDIFNHRLISLFYQAWKKYRYYLSFRPDGSDSISTHLRSLFGLDSEAVGKATGLPVVRLQRYAGILSLRTRTAIGLKIILADFFDGIPVRINEFIPQWVEIPEEYQSRLGKKNSCLGRDMSLGSQVLTRSGKFQVIIGPLSLGRYEEFLPDKEQFNTLKRLITMYVSYQLEFDLKFIIRGEDIPPISLSTQGTARLGYTTWLLSQPRADAVVVFEGS